MRLHKRQKESIIEICRGNFESVDALIIYGSYGRGEGATVFKNGRICLYNDVDILVVCAATIESVTKQRVVGLLKRELGTDWIDLSIVNRHHLTRLKATIQTYDLIHASELIYGDSTVYQMIPVLSINQIRSKEVLTLYLTRLSTFLYSLGGDKIEIERSGTDATRFNYQLAKSVLAVCDVAMLLNGDYAPLYHEKAERASLLPELVEHRSLLDWAIKTKLEPSSAMLTSNESAARFREIANLYLRIMRKGLGWHFQYPVNSTLCVERLVLRGFRNSLINLVRSRMRSRTGYMRYIATRLAQSYWLDGMVDQQFDWREASRLLQKYVDVKVKLDSLDELKIWLLNNH